MTGIEYMSWLLFNVMTNHKMALNAIKLDSNPSPPPYFFNEKMKKKMKIYFLCIILRSPYREKGGGYHPPLLGRSAPGKYSSSCTPCDRVRFWKKMRLGPLLSFSAHVYYALGATVVLELDLIEIRLCTIRYDWDALWHERWSRHRGFGRDKNASPLESWCRSLTLQKGWRHDQENHPWPSTLCRILAIAAESPSSEIGN